METTKWNVATSRKVVKKLLQRDLGKLKGKQVLEIGPGSWDFAKRILEKNRCGWYGVEPIDFGSKNITNIRGSVADLPFHNESFDVVLANQSMEHWFEYGVSFRKGLEEIHRVLKKDGVLMINVPIHNHGHPYFLRGRYGRIQRLFKSRDWSILLFEKALPGEKHKGWKQLGNKGWQSNVGYPDWFIPHARSAYKLTLNIHAKKIRLTPSRTLAVSRYRFVVVILRFVKEVLLGRF